MIYLIYGVGGMLAVLGLLLLGGYGGWKANEMFRHYSRRKTAEEWTQEQNRQLVAQQQAFEEMLRYNQDTAYGMASMDVLQGGEAE